MSILNQSMALVVYDDAESSNNPLQRYIDWKRNTLSVSVSNPQSKKYVLQPNSSSVLFSGSRTTAIDGTSAFSIALNTYNSSVYRITSTGGTAPAFRTDRALTMSASTITVVINNNATATFSASAGSFAAVQVGDTVFVPHTLTGDAALASPFSATNGGFWVVLARTASVLTLTRPSTESFSGVAEAVLLTSNAQLQAFSSAGVQVNDAIEISAGFSVVTQKTFVVSTVTPSWVEFVSTESLPLETGILPTATGLIFYTEAKRFIRIESDQEAVVRFNGDTGNTVRLSPRSAGSLSSGYGMIEKWGTAWQVEMVNKSRTSSMTVIVISAE